VKNKNKYLEFETPKGFNLPPDKIDDYDFKVHMNGKTHSLVLKDEYDKLDTKYAFVLGVLSTMQGFTDKTISEIVKWVEDSVK